MSGKAKRGFGVGRVMGRLRLMAVVLGLALAGPFPAQATTVVAVDPGFAPVASVLLRLFTDSTGHPMVLSVAPEGLLEQTPADVLLAPDADMPARLAEQGQAAADTQVTYATDPAAATPRDAVLLHPSGRDPVARAFLVFLLTPEAWEVIVAHGFGAH